MVSKGLYTAKSELQGFQNYREMDVAYSSAYQDIRNETNWSPATLLEKGSFI
jgi:hypothetical protein